LQILKNFITEIETKYVVQILVSRQLTEAGLKSFSFFWFIFLGQVFY
jgi:hypothetical protein